MLALNLQLCLLKRQPGFAKFRKQTEMIAAALEAQVSIPIIQAELPLIHDIQTDAWWQDVTLEMLEHMRRRLRGLVHLIERRKRAVIYSDFEDELGEGELISFDQFGPPDSFEKFKAKARFLPASASGPHRGSQATQQQPTYPDRPGRVGTDAPRERHRYCQRY